MFDRIPNTPLGYFVLHCNKIKETEEIILLSHTSSKLYEYDLYQREIKDQVLPIKLLKIFGNTKK